MWINELIEGCRFFVPEFHSLSEWFCVVSCKRWTYWIWQEHHKWGGKNLVYVVKISIKINLLYESHWCDATSSVWWNFFHVIEIDQFDKNLLMWLKFTYLMKIHHLLWESSLSWKYMIVMKSYNCDKNSS